MKRTRLVALISFLTFVGACVAVVVHYLGASTPDSGAPPTSPHGMLPAASSQVSAPAEPPATPARPAPEICDGVDNDFDGNIDEQCECAKGWAIEVPEIPMGDVRLFSLGQRGVLMLHMGRGLWLRTEQGWSRLGASPPREGAMFWPEGETGLVTVDFWGHKHQFDGRRWSQTTEHFAPLPEEQIWSGAAGASAEGAVYRTRLHFYTRSPEGKIVHAAKAPNTLKGMLAAPDGELLAFGAYGLVLRRRVGDAEFRVEPTGVPTDIEDAFALASNDAYAVTRELTLHWDGATWSPVLHLPGVRLSKVSANAAHDVLVAGHVLDDARERQPSGAKVVMGHFDGSEWSEVETPEFEQVLQMLPLGEGRYLVHATTRRGHGLWRHEAGKWVVEVPSNPSLTSIAGNDAGHAVAVGHDGTLLSYDGRRWTKRNVPVGAMLEGAWLAASGTAYAVGRSTDGKPLVLECTDASCVPMSFPHAMSLNAIWGANERNIFALADAGQLATYDGVSWKAGALPTDMHATAVSGTSAHDVYATFRKDQGENDVLGAVYHYDGKTWEDVGLPRDMGYTDLAVSSARDIVVVGGTGQGNRDNGVVHRYDGHRWTRGAWFREQNIASVWARAGHAPLVLTSYWAFDPDWWTLRRVQGDKAELVHRVQGMVPRKIWGTAPNNLFVVTEEGVIHHRCGRAPDAAAL